MNTRNSECERALRWLIANRRPKVSVEQTVRLLCAVLPQDFSTMQLLRRIAEETQTQETTTPRFNWRTPPGLPPRG